MDSRWNQYYGVVKKVSSLAGQWPYQRRRVRLFGLVIVTLSTISIIIPNIAKCIKCEGDLPCIYPILSSYLFISVILVKLYTCYLSNPKIRNLTDQLFVDWGQLRSPEEYEIMKKYAENGRRYSLGYTMLCLATMYLFISMSLIPHFLDAVLPLNESRPLLLTHPAYYFVDDREYFYYIFWHTVVAWEITLLGLIAHDCMLVTYVEHVCSIFAIVGFRFERLICKRTDSATIVGTRPSDPFHRQIVFSVHAHRRALQLLILPTRHSFAQVLEDTFSLTLAVQIAMITIMISITLLQVTLGINDMLETVRYIAFVMGQLINIFCLSFEGQKLIDHSLQAREKIYNSPWYEIPVKSQKVLLFVLQKSFYPTCMSAGKIYIFSMESFTTIVQMSMSYFTVLSSLE